MGKWLIGLFVVLCGSVASSQSISLPLQGYYRPGHFMPVRVEGAEGTADLHLEASGAMTTQVRQPRSSVTVPLLMQEANVSDLRALGEGWVTSSDAPLRPLTPAQRLVGATGGLPMGELVNGPAIVPIRLDPLDPLPGPALAWSGLDLLAVDEAAYRRIRPQTVDDLLVSGVTITVYAPAPPDDRPWIARSGWQVLEPAAIGPRGAPLMEDAYLPTYGWSPGWPAPIRRMVALAGIAVGILCIGATLLPRRVAVWGVVVVAAGGMAAAVALRTTWPPVFEMRADIAVEDAAQPRFDAWSWQKSRLGGEFAFLVRQPTWPIFASRQHRQRLPMHLRTAADGTPIAFVYMLPPNATATFLSRSHHPHRDIPDAMPVSTRLSPMLQRVYRGTQHATTDGSHVITVTPR